MAHNIIIVNSRLDALKGASNTTDGDLVTWQNQAVALDQWLANPPKEASETEIEAAHEWLESTETQLGDMVSAVGCMVSSCPPI